MPEGEKPQSFSASLALGFEFSQSEYISLAHAWQAPQAMGKGTTTRSPFLSFFTSGPTSTISPMNS
jgi:hypothetical protein